MTDYTAYGVLTVACIAVTIFFLFVNIKAGGTSLLKRWSYYLLMLSLIGVGWFFTEFAWAVLHAR